MYKLLLAFVFFANFAFAACEPRIPSEEENLKAMHAALQTQNFLEHENPEVAIIARIGSDVSKHNIKYTHAGYVFRDSHFGKWSVVHLLNQCEDHEAGIFTEGLVNFYLDDLFKFDTLVIIPKKDVQAKLVKFYKSPEFLSMFYNNYNKISYPFSTKYQNSNQWVLETYLKALNNKFKDRAEIQEFLKSRKFPASKVSVSFFEKWGANLTKNNIKFDGHPSEEVDSGTYSIISADSLLNFFKAENQVKSVKELEAKF